MKWLYDAGGVLMMQGLTGFGMFFSTRSNNVVGVGSFAGLSWERGYTFMSALQFSAIPFMGVLLIIAWLFPAEKSRKVETLEKEQTQSNSVTPTPKAKVA